MMRTRYLQLMLFPLALLGITVGSALGTPKPPTIEINDRVVLVQIKGQQLIVKIQTRSAPQRYSSRIRYVSIGMSSNGDVMSTRCISKQYVQDNMLVMELDLPRITYRLRSFDWINITIVTPKFRSYESYRYRSDKPIYEELIEPYTSPPPIVSIVPMKIIITVQTRFMVEQYEKNIVEITFYDRFSQQIVALRRADVSKQYRRNGVFEVVRFS